MLFNATSGVISGTPSLYAILADETRFFIEGTYNQYTISTSFIMQLKSMICHYYFYNYLDHDELPVSSGLSGCYLSFSTSCFVEEESFYSTRPFDICKSESSIDFSDDFEDTEVIDEIEELEEIDVNDEAVTEAVETTEE